MSHVLKGSTVPGKPLLTDLKTLTAAMERLGLHEIPVEDFVYYSNWRGQERLRKLPFPLVKAYRVGEKGCRASCYDIGVVADEANPGGYIFAYDPYMGAQGLEKIIGQRIRVEGVEVMAPLAVQAYRIQCDVEVARKQGDQIKLEKLPDGSWKSVTLVNPERLREKY